MKKILFYLLDKFYFNDFIEFKKMKLKEDNQEFKIYRELHYKKLFGHEDYNRHKSCPKGCGRTIDNCNCMDRAFGY